MLSSIKDKGRPAFVSGEKDSNIIAKYIIMLDFLLRLLLREFQTDLLNMFYRLGTLIWVSWSMISPVAVRNSVGVLHTKIQGQMLLY